MPSGVLKQSLHKMLILSYSESVSRHLKTFCLDYELRTDCRLEMPDFGIIPVIIATADTVDKEANVFSFYASFSLFLLCSFFIFPITLVRHLTLVSSRSG